MAYSEDVKYIPTYTLKFENLEKEIKYFCQTNKLIYKPDNIDISKYKNPEILSDYRKSYTNEQIKQLENLWQPYMSQFGYTFNE